VRCLPLLSISVESCPTLRFIELAAGPQPLRCRSAALEGRGCRTLQLPLPALQRPVAASWLGSAASPGRPCAGSAWPAAPARGRSRAWPRSPGAFGANGAGNAGLRPCRQFPFVLVVHGRVWADPRRAGGPAAEYKACVARRCCSSSDGKRLARSEPLRQAAGASP